MLTDNIYVINLDNSTERLQNITKNFNENGIKFNRYSAIYGKTMDSETLDKNTTLLCKTIFCNYGIIGCAMSHLNLWKQLVNDQNANYYIIFEDDALIDKDFKTVIEEIDAIKEQLDFDILSLFCGPGHNCYHYKKIYKLSNGISIGKPIYPLLFTSYIISKKGAVKLLSLIDKINYHIDFEVATQIYLSGVNYLSLDKNIVLNNWSSESTIETHNHKSIVLSLLNILRLKQIYWLLNVSVLTINLKYTINLYTVLLIVLLIINMLWIKSIIIYAIIFAELILIFQ
ncbi:glycosyltransferase family 25 [Catovirus CTV1]|uniref:Glycosyltransferase family 25 n=1 Tax=Catovirus CTV1 TaxID=1977631 RepID=A0A1V0SBR2_9VIRU|nr:glycosyltransferase family 25 [Catovirus CTV1]